MYHTFWESHEDNLKNLFINHNFTNHTDVICVIIALTTANLVNLIYLIFLKLKILMRKFEHWIIFIIENWIRNIFELKLI